VGVSVSGVASEKKGLLDVADEAEARYKVVVNDEQQYSIWLEGRANAHGWHDEGVVGSKEECLAHIGLVWTDMRPLSLRKAMEETRQDLD
jgi:MbtH protein